MYYSKHPIVTLFLNLFKGYFIYLFICIQMIIYSNDMDVECLEGIYSTLPA